MTRFPKQHVHGIKDGDRYSVHRIALPAMQQISLFATHELSLVGQGSESQTLNINTLVAAIERTEKECGHARTLVMAGKGPVVQQEDQSEGKGADDDDIPF